jgi:hypothetical protein
MIAEPTLRPLLRFNNTADPDAFRDEISACCFDGQGRLWCGTDELNGLSCLTPQPAAASGAATFGAHRYVDLAGALELPDGRYEEIDIEGMDYGEGRIWIVGSHTATRRKADPDQPYDEQLRVRAGASTSGREPPAGQGAHFDVLRGARMCRKPGVAAVAVLGPGQTSPPASRIKRSP